MVSRAEKMTRKWPGCDGWTRMRWPRQHEGDQQRATAHQPMAAVVYLVLGFLFLVSKHNEVAMLPWTAMNIALADS
jgi:hypothetical protein